MTNSTTPEKNKITEIILCTGNKGKVREFQNVFATQDCKVNIKIISDIYEGEFDPEETGSTFAANALIKAQAGAKLTNAICLSDDSGIEIDALDGRPGIYSGRYLKQKDGGLDGVLYEMKEQDKRSCRFVCNLCLVNAKGDIIWQEETYWQGELAKEARGDNGFGYDPIVIPQNENPENKTVAELPNEYKASRSHRGQGILALTKFLNS